MKLVKPTALSFTCRPLLLLGRQQLTLTSLVGFSLAPDAANAPRLIPEIALWPAIAEVTGGLDYRTEKEMTLRAENVLASARALVKVDGEQIPIG
jgi:hypothetical protein